MGIKGIYQEIGPGQRIALAKLAIETYERTGRPLRIAIDISIWLFQIQSGQGGTNPALRTFYYRLLRLISLSIHPLFVFDGPNKPPFKRHKRTGPNVASIPEFLAKQLLKQFGLTFHIAPGEAEAECAHLQRKGVVDAVLSEDVDTLMFGSGLTLRNWSSDTKGPPTHVNLYDAQKTKDTAGLDRDGMILVALMSGGDYIPEGIPGCGIKTACQAARAGFGRDLIAIGKDDDSALAEWKARLRHELCTNESKYFQRKAKAMIIPDDFPRRDILRYYTHPCLSPDERITKLERTIKWDQDIDFDALRTFTGEAFEWICVGGAKKFIRNLAPAMLVRALRTRNLSSNESESDNLNDIAASEAKLIRMIDKRRNHVTTDESPEIKVGFIPHDLVPIDLDAEDPDPELPMDGLESDEEVARPEDGELADPKKKRGPSQYDPTQVEKIWVPETLLKVGVPLKMEDWEASFRNARAYEIMKAQKRAEKVTAARSPKKKVRSGMRQGALDRFAKTTKPGVRRRRSGSKDLMTSTQPSMLTSTSWDVAMEPGSTCPPVKSSAPPPCFPATTRPASSQMDFVNLISSPPQVSRVRTVLRRSRSVDITTNDIERAKSTPEAQQRLKSVDVLDPIPELPPSITTRRRRSPFRRTQTLPDKAIRLPSPPPSTVIGNNTNQSPPSLTSRKRSLSVSQTQPPPSPTTPSRRRPIPTISQAINLVSSSPVPTTPKHRQRSIADYLSPSPQKPRPPSASFVEPPRAENFGIVAKAVTDNEVAMELVAPADKDPFLDRRKPAETRSEIGTSAPEVKSKDKPKRRQPLQPVSDNVSAGDVVLVNAGDSKPASKRAFRTLEPANANEDQDVPSMAPTTAANTQITRIRRVLRIRDSLPGTYALDVLDMTDPTGIITTVSKPGGNTTARKRKESPPGGAQGRKGRSPQKRWRVSQVEVLDLTGG